MYIQIERVRFYKRYYLNERLISVANIDMDTSIVSFYLGILLLQTFTWHDTQVVGC